MTGGVRARVTTQGAAQRQRRSQKMRGGNLKGRLEADVEIKIKDL
jgi:hypothetical protein